MDYLGCCSSVWRLKDKCTLVGCCPVQLEHGVDYIETMRAEKEAGALVHKLRAGRLIKDNLWGRTAELLRLGALGKMLVSMGAVVVAAWFAASLGGHSLSLVSGLA